MGYGAAMAYAELDGDVIALTTEFRDAQLVRSVPGAVYKSALNRWHVPVSWAACLTLQGLFGARLQVGPDLSAWAQRYATEHVQPALDLRSRLTPPTPDDRYAKHIEELGMLLRAGV